MPLQERSIFIAALDKASPQERAAFLDEACGLDAAMRWRVEGLLRSHAQAGSFLGAPAVEEQFPAGTYATPVAEGPGSRIGPYKLLERLGEGGMGVVFMAEQEAPRGAQDYQAGGWIRRRSSRASRPSGRRWR